MRPKEIRPPTIPGQRGNCRDHIAVAHEAAKASFHAVNGQKHACRDAILRFKAGKQLRILAKGDRLKPVKRWTLNGVELPISVDYRQLMQGGELVFEF